jgi:hypothetical protein
MKFTVSTGGGGGNTAESVTVSGRSTVDWPEPPAGNCSAFCDELSFAALEISLVSGKLIALMMMGPQSTQTTQSLFQYQAATAAKAIHSKSQCFKLARPARPNWDFGLPAVSASDGQNLSDFCCQIACRKSCGGIAAPLSRTVVPAQPSA